MKIKLSDGGIATVEHDRFHLIVVAEGGAKIEALSEDFEALLDLQHQLSALGYSMRRLESIGSLLRG